MEPYRLFALTAAMLALGCIACSPHDAREDPSAEDFSESEAIVDSRIPVGLYDRSQSTFQLKNDDPGGPPTITFTYGSAIPSKDPIAGDWNDDGTDTIGLYSANEGRVYLRNSNSTGYADITYDFDAGDCWVNCTPLAGKWLGLPSAGATPGLYDAYSGTFYLRETNDPTSWYLTVVFKPTGWRWWWHPIAGDWDGDGRDTVGVYDPSTGNFHLADSNAFGSTYRTINYRPQGATMSWLPLTGQFDRHRFDSVGLYDTSERRFYIAPVPSRGLPEITFVFGTQAGAPITGNWDGRLGHIIVEE